MEITSSNNTKTLTQKQNLKDIIKFLHKFSNEDFMTVEELESLVVLDITSKSPVFYACQKMIKLIQEKVMSTKNLLPETPDLENDIMRVIQKLFDYSNTTSHSYFWTNNTRDLYGKKIKLTFSYTDIEEDDFQLVYNMENLPHGNEVRSPYMLLHTRTKFLQPLIDFSTTANDDGTITFKQNRIVAEDTEHVEKGFFRESHLLNCFKALANRDKYLKPFSDEINKYPSLKNPLEYDILKYSAVIEKIREHQKIHINRFVEMFFQSLDEDIVSLLTSRINKIPQQERKYYSPNSK